MKDMATSTDIGRHSFHDEVVASMLPQIILLKISMLTASFDGKSMPPN
jgi:hypothetical protein